MRYYMYTKRCKRTPVYNIIATISPRAAFSWKEAAV